jgi:hypothetical protein
MSAGQWVLDNLEDYATLNFRLCLSIGMFGKLQHSEEMQALHSEVDKSCQSSNPENPDSDNFELPIVLACRKVRF